MTEIKKYNPRECPYCDGSNVRKEENPIPVPFNLGGGPVDDMYCKDCKDVYTGTPPDPTILKKVIIAFLVILIIPLIVRYLYQIIT